MQPSAGASSKEGPAQISREDGQRRISVELNVRNRDIASSVREAQRQLLRKYPSRLAIWSSGAASFEQLESASRRLAIAVPVALLGIVVLLYLNFSVLLPAVLIFLNIPLAATGGILALAGRGMPFSISAGVGFIALFGIAVLNGIVLLTYISQLRRDGMKLEDAVVQGSIARLRPVLMTALVASFGFRPMALSQGAGAEVQRPLATVVIGGLVTSTLLTLGVLPALYNRLAKDDVAQGTEPA